MKVTLSRVAAAAILTLAVSAPLATTAQAAEVSTQRAAASDPCRYGGCWDGHHHGHHHGHGHGHDDHHLLDLDATLL
ncbi:hypothetical protein GCM10010277_35580 [Streptomyces longisporoflavus]|uniref:hypothetical protein n=1 Tax=Streptomyces longisporoflavus TaxID=28044 RepID=UPI00167EA668|nr:hypothetical protein [Streptomyces longisporoflavus]GGV44846.1 hypothetical protein GCM10010277_35580 [Streptomyces longisporoflavus]